MALDHVTIVGAGSVGAAVALCVAADGSTRRIAMIDVDAGRAEAEALDLAHGGPFLPAVDVEGGGDPSLLDGSDLVIIAAGAKQEPGQSRLELAGVNAEICRQAVDLAAERSPGALVLVVSNPVDVLTQVASSRHPGGASAVLGSGTVLDTARLRVLLAAELDVAPTAVHATVVGEHGDSEFVPWSCATIGGVTIGRWLEATGLDPGIPERVLEGVRGAAQRIISGKGWTSTAIGLSVARIVGSIADDDHAVLPVSTVQHVDRVGEVALSLPAVVGRSGVVSRVPMELEGEELAWLQHSARAIQSVTRTVIED